LRGDASKKFKRDMKGKKSGGKEAGEQDLGKVGGSG